MNVRQDINLDLRTTMEALGGRAREAADRLAAPDRMLSRA